MCDSLFAFKLNNGKMFESILLKFIRCFKNDSENSYYYAACIFSMSWSASE